MLSFDLAKKLKDAGFIQYGNGEKLCLPQYRAKYVEICYISCSCDHVKDEVYFPTLSELIGACGDDFESLGIGGQGINDSNWHCVAKNRLIEFGDTPEEAVANLWIELNKLDK